MTIATTDSRVQYTGNGATTVWDYEFIVPEAAAMFVVETDIATNESTTLDPSLYTVAGIGSEDGGTVTYPLTGPALTSAKRLTIYREVEYIQEAAFTNQDGFYPEVVESSFDRMVMMIQQLVDRLSRALVSNASGSAIDAGGLEIINVGQGIDDSSAATMGDIRAAQMALGNVPTPGGGATGRFLRALSGTTWGWVTFTVAMLTDASSLGRQLIQAGSASAMRALLEIPDVDPASGDTGDIKARAGTTIPTGWLECDGAAVNRTTYAALFTEIGTAYGVGNGSTTFNLPDLRGEFLRGWDHARGVDVARTIGSAQTDLVKAHTHTASASTTGSTDSGGAHTHTVTAVGTGTADASGVAGGSFQSIPTSLTTSSSGAHNHTINSLATSVTVNANTGAENRPRNVAVMYVIKT